MKTIEELAKDAYEKDKSLPLKYQTPDNFWIDWFIKGFQAAQQWINVADELPKVNEIVLVKYITAKGLEKFGIAKLNCLQKIIGRVDFIIEGSCSRNVVSWRPIERR